MGESPYLRQIGIFIGLLYMFIDDLSKHILKYYNLLIFPL